MDFVWNWGGSPTSMRQWTIIIFHHVLIKITWFQGPDHPDPGKHLKLRRPATLHDFLQGHRSWPPVTLRPWKFHEIPEVNGGVRGKITGKINPWKSLGNFPGMFEYRGPFFFWETATGDCFTLHVVGPSRFSLALHGTNVDTHRLRIIRIEQIMGCWLWFLLSRDLPIFTLYCYIVMFIVHTDTLHIWSYMHTVYVRFRQDYYT